MAAEFAGTKANSFMQREDRIEEKGTKKGAQNVNGFCYEGKSLKVTNSKKITSLGLHDNFTWRPSSHQSKLHEQEHDILIRILGLIRFNLSSQG